MANSRLTTPHPRKRLLQALVIAAAAASLSAQEAAKPETTNPLPTTSDTCITMKPNPVSGYDLVNSCPVCRTGLVTWCDGDGHPFDVHANSTVRIPACPGIQALVTDVPCEHPR